MSNKKELKQRKPAKESSDDSREDRKTETDAKTAGKAKAPSPISAADAKRAVDEQRNQMGKKMFWRSVNRIGLIALAFSVIYLYSWLKGDTTFTPFASSKDDIHNVPLAMQVPCAHDDYRLDRELFPKCAPKVCGRVVIDNLIDERESAILLALFKKALLLNPLSSNQSVSILDLHSGALTYGTKFVNVYSLMQAKNRGQYFTQTEFSVYRQVKNKIHKHIAEQFQIPADSLHLTSPTFFSRLTGLPAQSLHDEYWHTHIDKETYKSFHYTSLLYLNTYYQGFSGGRFVFADKTANYSVEPKQSRVSAFTSGSENPHFVERVDKGTRYAITISFTCDPQLAIQDPKLG